MLGLFFVAVVEIAAQIKHLETIRESRVHKSVTVLTFL